MYLITVEIQPNTNLHMNGNAYDAAYNDLYRERKAVKSTSRKSSSIHHKSTTSSHKKTQHASKKSTKITHTTTTTNLIQPSATSTNVIATATTEVAPSSIATQMASPMTPVYISPSSAPSSAPAVSSNTPDASKDDSASVITGVAFAGLILFIVLVFIMRRRHMKYKDLECCSADSFHDDTMSITSKTRLRPNQLSYVPYKQPVSEVSCMMLTSSPRSSIFDQHSDYKQKHKVETKTPSPVRISLSHMNQDIARFSLKKTDSWGNYVKQVLHKPTMNEASNVPQPTAMSASAHGVCEFTISPPETSRCKTESTISPNAHQDAWCQNNQDAWCQNSNFYSETLSTTTPFPQQQIMESYHPLAALPYNSVSPAPNPYQSNVNYGQGPQQAVRVNLTNPISHQMSYRTDAHAY